MVVVRNPFLPLPAFDAFNLFGILFVRRGTKLSPSLLRHERIHTLQQRELLFFGFYLLYMIEWLCRFVRCGNSELAYLNMSFEREAYRHQSDADYLLHRPAFAQWREA